MVLFTSIQDWNISHALTPDSWQGNIKMNLQSIWTNTGHLMRKLTRWWTARWRTNGIIVYEYDLIVHLIQGLSLSTVSLTLKFFIFVNMTPRLWLYSELEVKSDQWKCFTRARVLPAIKIAFADDSVYLEASGRVRPRLTLTLSPCSGIWLVNRLNGSFWLASKTLRQCDALQKYFGNRWMCASPV